MRAATSSTSARTTSGITVRFIAESVRDARGAGRAASPMAPATAAGSATCRASATPIGAWPALGWRPRLSSDEAVRRAVARDRRQEATATRDRQAVIVAGGKGTRMAGAASPACPSRWSTSAATPVLQHQLEPCARSGVAQRHRASSATRPSRSRRSSATAHDFGLDRASRRSTASRWQRRRGASPRWIGSAGRSSWCSTATSWPTSISPGSGRACHLGRGRDFTTLHPNDHPFDSDLVEIDADGRVSAIHPYPHPTGDAASPTWSTPRSTSCDATRCGLLRERAARSTSPGTCFRPCSAAGARVIGYRQLRIHQGHRHARPAATRRRGRLRRGVAPARAGTPPQPAVFLDRDGTLNVETRLPQPRRRTSSCCRASAAALRRLRDAGFRWCVVTNQPVIARGEATEADIAAHPSQAGMGARQGRRLCRRHLPLPASSGRRLSRRGRRAEDRLRLPQARARPDRRAPAATSASTSRRSWMVGDHTRDIETARRAGACARSWCAPAMAAATAAFDARRPTLRRRRSGGRRRARSLRPARGGRGMIISQTPLRVSFVRRRLATCRPTIAATAARCFPPPSTNRSTSPSAASSTTRVRVSYSRTEEVRRRGAGRASAGPRGAGHAGHRGRRRDHLGRRHPGARHGARLVQRLHRRPAATRCTPTRAVTPRPRDWPSRPARSRSSAAASRSASRTSTPRPSAASTSSASIPTTASR